MNTHDEIVNNQPTSNQQKSDTTGRVQDQMDTNKQTASVTSEGNDKKSQHFTNKPLQQKKKEECIPSLPDQKNTRK